MNSPQECPACLNGCGGARSDCPMEPHRKALEPVKVGRPSTYSPDTASAVCAHLASGGLLVEWCNEPGRPHVATIYRWMEAHPEFRDAYARAREVGLHVMAEEVIAISDDGSRDYKLGPDGDLVPDHDHIARSRLRVDSRKWLASKILPKVYGDKITQEHTGPGGGPIALTWKDGSS